jgi:uncharacterized SAM-binding protein YcdF (DUF218 family)
MTAAAPTSSTVPRVRRWRRGRLIGAILVLVFLAASLRLFVFPSLPALPGQVDAIVELGGPGDRDRAALDLARAHRARYVVQSTVESDAQSDTCLPPVPGVTVLCFHAEPNTTRGEAQAIQRLAADHGWKSVILVTTPDQAKRARLRVTRCFAGDVYVSTASLPVLDYLWQIPYQWMATLKALTVERDC